MRLTEDDYSESDDYRAYITSIIGRYSSNLGRHRKYRAVDTRGFASGKFSRSPECYSTGSSASWRITTTGNRL